MLFPNTKANTSDVVNTDVNESKNKYKLTLNATDNEFMNVNSTTTNQYDESDNQKVSFQDIKFDELTKDKRNSSLINYEKDNMF